MDFVVNNGVFILILALFVGMHLVRFGEKPENSRIRTPQIPSSRYSSRESAARRMKEGAPLSVRHATFRKGDRR
jgi:hypothetical protein